MLEEIIVASIEALGTVAAAVIGVGYFGKIIERRAARFLNYEDKEHDLHKVLRRSRKSITIIANCGNMLLEKHADELRSCMKKGIKINYILLDAEHFFFMDHYTRCTETADYVNLLSALQDLERLKQEYSNKLSVRVFHTMLTASFIAIDLNDDLSYQEWEDTAVIQIMPYLYHTKTGVSPITYLTPQNKERFTTVKRSIMEIWYDAEEVNVTKYISQIRGIMASCQIRMRNDR